MRVLLDANLPVAFAALLTGHQVENAHARGWSDLDNGELLAVCDQEFDAIVTLDQSLQYQQNLRGRPIAVLVLRARSNRLQDLEPLAAPLLAALPHAAQGEVTIVGAKP